MSLLIVVVEGLCIAIGASLGGWAGHGLTGSVIGVALMQIPAAIAMALIDDEYGIGGAVFMLLFGSVIVAVRTGEVTRPLYGWSLFAGELVVSSALILMVRRVIWPWLEARPWVVGRGKRAAPAPPTSIPRSTPSSATVRGRTAAVPDASLGSHGFAQEVMRRTPCESCGNVGYDLETFAPATSSWYLGRCPECGHTKDFEFR